MVRPLTRLLGSYIDCTLSFYSGGGIGGLSLAVMLDKFAKKEIQIDIYESKDKFAELGAGISVWKRTWYILELLGLEKALGEMAVKPPVEEFSEFFSLSLNAI